MNSLYSSSDPLGALGTLTTPWLDRGGSGDVPYVVVSVLSDQAGRFLLYTGETADENEHNIIGGGDVAANIATVVSANVSRRFVRMVYTNGATAQTTFATTILGSSTPHIAPASADGRALDLILRELRVQSLLLENLKAPSPSIVNLPYGPTNSSR